MERQKRSIREFAKLCGVSHTEIGRKMTQLGVKGQREGRGKPTYLSPDEQDRIAQTLFVPAEEDELNGESQQDFSVGGDLATYIPMPLQTRLQRGEDERFRSELKGQVALNLFERNRNTFRQTLIALSEEEGKNLGNDMADAQISAAMRQYDRRQEQMGKSLGVIQKSPLAADGSSDSAGAS